MFPSVPVNIILSLNHKMAYFHTMHYIIPTEPAGLTNYFSDYLSFEYTEESWLLKCNDIQPFRTTTILSCNSRVL